MDDEVLVPDAAAWRAWLAEHHASSPGVPLVLAKKGVTDPTSLTYEQALLEALCFGWIDSRVNRRDDATMYQRFGPRRATSPWSARNVERVTQLIAEGLMEPAGQAEIDRAQADGRWNAAYAGPAGMPVPDELTTALAASPVAAAWWDVLTSQNRYAILFRLHHLKTAAGRAKRIAATVDQLARGELPYPQKRHPD